MTFFCNSCEQDRDFFLDYGILIISDNKTVQRICRICRAPKAAMPDVYWDGKPEENLADDPATGKPRVFASKHEKASYLKERGLVESGDTVHGAPLFVSKQAQPKIDTRAHVKMVLKRVKEMGRDVRRQAYLKIMKERQRA